MDAIMAFLNWAVSDLDTVSAAVQGFDMSAGLFLVLAFGAFGLVMLKLGLKR